MKEHKKAGKTCSIKITAWNKSLSLNKNKDTQINPIKKKDTNN